MKRITRRVVAVLAGLALGWYVAGFVPGSLARDAAPGVNVTLAQPAEPAQAAHPHLTSPEENAPAPDLLAAQQLVPHEDTSWYLPVLWAVVGLFVAAIVLGVPALKIKGPEPPDPAAAHDDHGPDDHAAAHDH